MPKNKCLFPLSFLSSLALALLTGLWLFPGQPVSAQCGSQASSCKNCHEVQAEFPVNTDGTGWHESHAFGDFCYICHAGNQQATDMEESHAGLVSPLSDIEASCQMCHAADLDERAQVYATILNVDLSSSGAAESAAPTSAPSSDDFWGGAPAATTAPTEAAAPAAVVDQSDDEAAQVCVPVGHELIVDDASLVNYAQRYDEIVLGQRPVNWGNIALGAMIALLVLGGGGFVVLNEIRVNTALGETRQADGEYPADVVDMLPVLARMKRQTRRALRHILTNPHKFDWFVEMIDTVAPDEEDEEQAQ
ncbi:MAG: hypothetical protein CL610_16350 [Anaerolineaceae bacterium]|nr:hypothetical protein [Anaerolineaceae bacterium]